MPKSPKKQTKIVSSSKTKRNSRVKKSKRISCKSKTSISDNNAALSVINSLKWDIQFFPDDALLNEIPVRDNPNINQVSWCNGEVKLLLPIVPVFDDTAMAVYYMEKLRKATISVRDVIYHIYNFYNNTKIVPGDLTYIAITDSMKKYAQSTLSQFYKDPKSIDNLRFFHFLANQTKFKGLKHQYDNVYSVQLDS